MTNAMTMAHTGAQMLVNGRAKPEQITPDGVHAFAVAIVALEEQRDLLLAALKQARESLLLDSRITKGARDFPPRVKAALDTADAAIDLAGGW